MAVQNEVDWLIGIIKTNYPATFPDNLARVNRDEPETVYPDDSTERQLGPESDQYNSVGVATGSVNRELYGTGPQYRVDTVLDVRVESKADEEWGESASASEFNTLVRYIQHAINAEVTYPDVDPTAEDIGFITYLDLRIENEQALSAGDKDYYRTDFSVRLRGNIDPRKGDSNTAFEASFEGAFMG